MNDLQRFKDNLETSIFGNEAKNMRLKGLCINCKEPALANCYSNAGRKEYTISGLCEKCFDSIMEE